MPDAREFGSKTNISLYNAHTVRLLTADKRLEQTKSLDFRLIRRARHDAHQLQMIGEYPGTFYKSLNAVPAIIINLLLCEINNIKLFKNTLYVGRKTHSNTYRSANSQMPRDRSRVFKTILVNHDLIVQKNFLRILNEKNAIKMDGHISNKLDMEYLKVVNAIHQVKKNIVIFAETPLHFRLAKKLLKTLAADVR